MVDRESCTQARKRRCLFGRHTHKGNACAQITVSLQWVTHVACLPVVYRCIPHETQPRGGLGECKAWRVDILI